MRISVFGRAKQAAWSGLLLVAASGLTPVATAGETPPGQPDRLPVAGRRSHIQPIGEMRKPQPADQVAAAGLQLSRAPEILRRQLALSRGEGLVVDAVATQSAAATIGIQPHDVLVRLDDQLLVLPEQLAVLLETIPFPSSKVSTNGHGTDGVLTILRAGQPLQIPLGPPATGPVAAVSMPRPTPNPHRRPWRYQPSRQRLRCLRQNTHERIVRLLLRRPRPQKLRCPLKTPLRLLLLVARFGSLTQRSNSQQVTRPS